MNRSASICLRFFFGASIIMMCALDCQGTSEERNTAFSWKLFLGKHGGCDRGQEVNVEQTDRPSTAHEFRALRQGR